MIPPVVRTLVELEAVIVRDHLGVGWRADGPRAEIDQHHQQDRHHPLQQLLVRQLHLVSALHPIRERDPERRKIVESHTSTRLVLVNADDAFDRVF